MGPRFVREGIKEMMPICAVIQRTRACDDLSALAQKTVRAACNRIRVLNVFKHIRNQADVKAASWPVIREPFKEKCATLVDAFCGSFVADSVSRVRAVELNDSRAERLRFYSNILRCPIPETGD